jgi:hypothetical protein
MTTQTKKRAQCAACHQDFEYDWKELAKHVSAQKDKAHRRSLLLTLGWWYNTLKKLEGLKWRTNTAQLYDSFNRLESCKRLLSFYGYPL